MAIDEGNNMESQHGYLILCEDQEQASKDWYEMSYPDTRMHSLSLGQKLQLSKGMLIYYNGQFSTITTDVEAEVYISGLYESAGVKLSSGQLGSIPTEAVFPREELELDEDGVPEELMAQLSQLMNIAQQDEAGQNLRAALAAYDAEKSEE